MEIASSSSSSLPKSRAMVRFRISSFNDSQTHTSTSIHILSILFIFFFHLNVSPAISGSYSTSSISYAKHCNSVVQESPPTDAKLPADDQFLWMQNAYYEGGEPIFQEASKSDSDNSPRYLSLQPNRLHRTLAAGIIRVEANLILRHAKMFAFLGNSTHRRRLYWARQPRFPIRRGVVTLRLHGFWSSASAKLCMVGSGSSYAGTGNLRRFSVVLKLSYRNSSSIVSSLVNGTLKSLDVVGSLNYFEPIYVLGISLMNYEYTLIEKENENGGFSIFDGYENVSLGLERDKKVCSLLARLAHGFELEYESNCTTVICNPLGQNFDILPSFISFKGVQCSDKQRLRALVGFSNSFYNGYYLPFDPKTTLVAEGFWDEKKNRLCLVACRVVNFTYSSADTSLGDCTIKLCFRFPATLSIRNRSTVVGHIWSNKTRSDLGYFDGISFQDSGNRMLQLPGLKYEYTEIGKVSSFCAVKRTGKNKQRTYPDGYSFDMRFDMSVKNGMGQKISGHLSPVSVADQFYGPYFVSVSRSSESEVPTNTSHNSIINMSCKISLMPFLGFKLGGEIYSMKSLDISAEGIYDPKTGVLCLIGCRPLESFNKKYMRNDSMDCEIHVNVQYAPLNTNGRTFIKGSIRSARGKSNPLYFDPLELSSNPIYTNQAKESIWRMDLEITMVLISHTLACVFVGSQLFYMKKHPEVLPFISIVMLIVVTLGHMIPLVLNFEALILAKPNRQNVFLHSGGWLEVNEVIVRLVMIVAFLLQFRLLQLTWTSRLSDESYKHLWVPEKKVLYLSFPLYVGGGLIAWFVHWWKSPYQSPLLRGRHSSHHHNFLLRNLRSYAGLVLDDFLLPQIMFNIFSNSRHKALAPPFYIGGTIVRLLPHAYHLCRIRSSTWLFDFSYIYGNPKMDFYSTTWDIIIPCCGLLFAVVIYLQQRFGSHSVLPKRFGEFCV